jgi:hypothetical protein
MSVYRRSIAAPLTPMTLADFRQSLIVPEPPAGLSHALAGLWWDAKGDWMRAHESAQQMKAPTVLECMPIRRFGTLGVLLQFVSVHIAGKPRGKL